MPLPIVQDESELVEVLSAVDLSAPRGERGGRPAYSVRCRVPFRLAIEPRVGGITREVVAPEDRAEGDPASEPDPSDDEIEGVASSTSRDWYGTRMSVDCLRGMAGQFERGVTYLAAHPSWIMGGGEWTDQIGITSAAKLRRAEVAEPVDGTDGWELVVRTRLWMDVEKAEALVRHVDKGRPVGQSIGGWFTEVSVTYDEDFNVQDIVVEECELDHLAAVRSPANPDSDKVWMAFSRGLAQARSRSATLPAPADPNTNTPDGDPPTDGEPSQRDQVEIDMTPEDLEAAIQRAVALALTAHRAENPAPAPAPEPAPVRAAPTPAADPIVPDPRDAELAELRAARAADQARYVASEARARVAEAVAAAQTPAAPAQRSGAQATRDPAPATPAQPEVPDVVRQMKELAPMAWRTAAMSLGDVEFTPGLISMMDGDEVLADVCRARKETRNVCALLEKHPELLDVRELADLVGATVRPEDGAEAKRRHRASRERGRTMLADVLYAGMRDKVHLFGERGNAGPTWHAFA